MKYIFVQWDPPDREEWLTCLPAQPPCQPCLGSKIVMMMRTVVVKWRWWWWQWLKIEISGSAWRDPDEVVCSVALHIAPIHMLSFSRSSSTTISRPMVNGHTMVKVNFPSSIQKDQFQIFERQWKQWQPGKTNVICKVPMPIKWSSKKAPILKRGHFLAISATNLSKLTLILHDIKKFTQTKNLLNVYSVEYTSGSSLNWKNIEKFTQTKNLLNVYSVEDTSGSSLHWKDIKTPTPSRKPIHVSDVTKHL